MFENITKKLDDLFKKIRSRGKLSENDIKETLREIKIVLLEADVNFKVVKEFIEKVREKAANAEVMQSLAPGHQVIKIVNEELTALMGGVGKNVLTLAPNGPTVILVLGLQGSGKTTTVAKLGNYFKKEGHKVLLVPADTSRPAAMEQLKKLGETAQIDVFDSVGTDNPLQICENALKQVALTHKVIIFDTAGRLHIDADLMQELKLVKDKTAPHEVLLVVDGMTGQIAVNIAKTFDEAVGINGIVLTKMDGDAKGGAAISMKAVTQKPIKFIGTGEKLDALEFFYPDRIVQRILGMGDVLSLIEKAQESFSIEKGKELEKKLKNDSFDLEDFKEQLIGFKKMGPMEQLIDMIPGMKKLKVNIGDSSQKEMVRIEAIINSMTIEERKNYHLIDGSRKFRIARGSGTTVNDINRLLKQFIQTRKMMQQFSKTKGKGMENLLRRW